MIELISNQLSGYDFLIAGIIVVFVEFVLKGLIFKKASDKTKTIVAKVSPVVLGAATYVVMAFISKGVWYSGLFHGALVGLTAMGAYDLILKTMKDGLTTSAEDLNNKVKEAISDAKK